MRKAVILAAAAALLGGVAMAPAKPSGITFYVSPAGSDAWSGRRAAPNGARADGPFATLARARDAVREWKRQQGGHPSGPVTVFLRGGTYFLSEPFTLTPADNGAEGAPVTYAAYRGEHPVLSGGRRITGWQPVTVAGKKLWSVPLPGVREGKWTFRELWVDGRRRMRARWPKRGYLKVPAEGSGTPGPWEHGDDRFHFAGTDLKDWPSAGDAEVVVMTRWVESHAPIERVDEAARLVTLRKKSVFHVEPGDPYYVENAREFLDTPGEWYLSPETGTLSYLPTPGEEARLRSGRLEGIAPALPQVLRLEGRPEKGQFVERVAFRGLTFSHTGWWFPASAPTYGFGQAAVGVPGAVLGEGVRGCSFDGCSFSHLGTYGLELARGCRDNRVQRCHFSDLGAGGVKIGETAIRDNPAEQSGGSEVSDCRIEDAGRLFHSAVGLWIGQSAGNRILHNEIRDLYYTGISVGWTWGYDRSLASGTLVEGNLVHHVGVRSDGDGPILSDMGGIYTLGVRPETVIRGNVFHDVAGLKYGGWGIYFDEGSSGALAENNLVYRTTHGGLHQHYGRENVVRNNVFAFGRDAQVQATRPEPHRRFTFERNIVLWREGALFAGDLSDFHFVFDRNCYWREGGGDPLRLAQATGFGNLSFAGWQAHGMDPHSLLADPRFVDPDHADFTLRPDSPALQLGFVPFDVSGVGPRR